LIGVPIYSCSAGAVPIASALIEKGVPLGTAQPFILIFVGIIASGIMVVGFLLNYVF